MDFDFIVIEHFDEYFYLYFHEHQYIDLDQHVYVFFNIKFVYNDILAEAFA